MSGLTGPMFRSTSDMIQTAGLICLMCALVCSPALQAGEEEDRASLRALKATYEEAINTNDLAKMTPYLSDSFQGVMVTGESVQGRSAVESYWKKIRAMIGSGGSYTVAVTPGAVTLEGDLAIASGSAQEVVISGGQQFRFDSMWTAVCRRAGDGWKLERLQATMDPIDNVFVRARMRGAGIQYGAAGFIMGGIVTALVMTGLARARKARNR